MPLRRVRRSASLSLAPGSRLAVIADTHSRPHPRLSARLASLAPAAILHAGDIGAPAVTDELAKIAPVYAVRGNIDTHGQWPDTLVLEVTLGGATRRVLLTHIALAGAKLRADVRREAAVEGATLVVCGHSHIPFIGDDAGVSVFNPGAAGPRRFQLPVTLGVLDVVGGSLRGSHLDAATGGPWVPPARFPHVAPR